MNQFILFLAGGYSFFAGLLLLAISVGLGRHPKKWLQIAASLAALAGVILIVVSTTPIAIIWYGLLFITVILWVVAVRSEKFPGRWMSAAAYLLVMTIASGLILEVPRFVLPHISHPANRRLVILADSITAGVGDGEQTWPLRLKQNVDYEIVDLSHVGAVVGSGLDMLATRPLDGDLVLIELGGNDLLGSTPPEEFDQDLETLLKRLSAKNCTIVMFELPLPPFNYQFGYSQRELAARYNVALIPKRVLLDVLVGEQKTLDSIHLTDIGHQQMAELMEDLFASAMRGETGI